MWHSPAALPLPYSAPELDCLHQYGTVQPFSFAEQRIPHVCMGLWAGGNDIVSSSVLTQACSMHGAGLEEGIAASS